MASAEQSSGSTIELAKAYKPSEHEGKVWDLWMKAGAFEARPQRVLSGQREPYSILIPPPNVTAALHLGHALNNTLQDALVRMHRMRRYEVMWMPGTDHAGIATQAVVEKRVMKEEKKRKTDFTREAFIAKIQAFKDEYEKVITGQLQAMACSCDWSRQRFTMDEQCAAAVREAFFILFRDGLIYRGKRLVNWDPALQTAVADDECYDEEIDGAFYYLRYPVVLGSPALRAGSANGTTETRGGESRAAQGPAVEDVQPVTWGELAKRGYPGASEHDATAQAWITVATTRPETYLGDTGVALNPSDPRAASLQGLSVQLPLLGRVIPIITDSYVVLPERFARTEEEKNDPKAKMATGFLKVTPAHDPNDYEIGQRHSLPMVNMMSPDGKVSDKHGLSNVREASVFVGLKMADARKKVVEEFKARGLFEEAKPIRHSVKHSDRSKAIVEPYLSDQWYVKVTDPRMAQAANEALAKRVLPSGAGVSPSPSPGGTGVSPVPEYPSRSDPYRRLDPVSSNLNMHFRNLPHFQAGGSISFVTFRVRDGELSPQERDIVMSACRHWHGQRAEVLAVVVMPDHVHMLIAPFEASSGKWHSLSELLHTIKSFSAHQVGEHRKSKGLGGVWQDESFDRIVRDGDELREKIAYMQANPIKRGLAQKWKDYQWTHVSAGVERGQFEFAERVRGASAMGSSGTGETPVPPKAVVAKTPAPLAEAGTLEFFPERYTKTYEDWHNGIRDWCISRQLWWGHRIPVWSKVTTDEIDRAATVRVLNAMEAGVEFDVKCFPVSGSQASTLICVCFNSSGTNLASELLSKLGFKQDDDVLDTWFSSALWPLSTMGWPDPTKVWSDNSRSAQLNAGLLEAFNPTSVLCTAREIITLWVSRMVMFNRYLLGASTLRVGSGAHGAVSQGGSSHAERGGAHPSALGPAPFKHVYIHAVVQDGEGRKMSKSLGNGVDPLDIIATHGSDAMRYTLCQMATQTQDVRMPVQKDASGKNTSPKFDLGRNFANKVWNASRFALGMLAPARASSTSPPPVHAAQLSLLDRWMLSRLSAGVQHATSTLTTYQFAEHAQGLYQLVWNEFCDWYLEGVKPTIVQSAGQQAVLHATLDSVLRLLHPTMPSITESLWQVVFPLRERAGLASVEGLALAGTQPDASDDERALPLLARCPWPEPELVSSLRDDGVEALFDSLRALVGTVRDVRATHKVAPSRKIVLHLPAQGLPLLSGEHARELELLLCTFAGLARIERTGVPSTPGSVNFAHEGLALGASDLHDATNATDAMDAAKQAERARLEKLASDLTKSIATLEGRLANPGYADKAPAHMVQQTRDQLTKAKQELAAAQAALA
jgi:valyl-tRNA synthetase